MKNRIQKNKILLLILQMLLIGGIGYLTFEHKGLQFRLPGFEFDKYAQRLWQEPTQIYGSAQQLVDKCDFLLAKPKNQIASQCFTKDPLIANQVFLWGDSYAQMLTYGLIKNLPTNWQLLQVASRGCQASIYETQDSDSNYCKQSNYFALQMIEQTKPKIVIISQNGNLNKDNVSLFSKKLHEIGIKKVIFMGEPPRWRESLPKVVFRFLPRPTPMFTIVKLDTIALDERKAIDAKSLGLQKDDDYINLTRYLCNNDGCMVYISNSPEQSIVSLDDSHLTPMASNYISVNYLIPLFIDNQN